MWCLKNILAIWKLCQENVILVKALLKVAFPMESWKASFNINIVQSFWENAYKATSYKGILACLYFIWNIINDIDKLKILETTVFFLYVCYIK